MYSSACFQTRQFVLGAGETLLQAYFQCFGFLGAAFYAFFVKRFHIAQHGADFFQQGFFLGFKIAFHGQFLQTVRVFRKIRSLRGLENTGRRKPAACVLNIKTGRCGCKRAGVV